MGKASGTVPRHVGGRGKRVSITKCTVKQWEIESIEEFKYVAFRVVCYNRLQYIGVHVCLDVRLAIPLDLDFESLVNWLTWNPH